MQISLIQYTIFLQFTEDQPCLRGRKYWEEETCRCICKPEEFRECSTGFVYDAKDTCEQDTFPYCLDPYLKLPFSTTYNDSSNLVLRYHFCALCSILSDWEDGLIIICFFDSFFKTSQCDTAMPKIVYCKKAHREH